MTEEAEVRLGLPAPLDVVVALLVALQGSFPKARVRYEGSDLVVSFPEPED